MGLTECLPNRWKNIVLFLADGHIEIDNNLMEKIIRLAAIGRKNYLFAGSHDAAQRAAMIYTFFAACKQYGIDPEKWLNHVLNRIHNYKFNRLEELMPHNWKPTCELNTGEKSFNQCFGTVQDGVGGRLTLQLPSVFFAQSRPFRAFFLMRRPLAGSIGFF